MKETLILPEVETMEELVAQYEYRSRYASAYVKELNGYAIAVAYESCQGNFIGDSAVKNGGSLKTIISKGEKGDKVDYYIYLVEEERIDIYWLVGGIFDLFGSCFYFNFSNKTFESKSLSDEELSKAYNLAQKKISA